MSIVTDKDCRFRPLCTVSRVLVIRTLSLIVSAVPVHIVVLAVVPRTGPVFILFRILAPPPGIV